MPKINARAYSQYTCDALLLLGTLIKTARKQQKLAAHELAERAGISRGLLQRIEKGDKKCAIGAAFEVAALLGITLFESDQQGLVNHKRQVEEKLALLPQSVRKVAKVINDDF